MAILGPFDGLRVGCTELETLGTTCIASVFFFFFDSLAAECSHVHLSDRQSGDAADPLPLLFSAAVACAVSNWAADEFLMPRKG